MTDNSKIYAKYIREKYDESNEIYKKSLPMNQLLC